jgi:hypothetical protein
VVGVIGGGLFLGLNPTWTLSSSMSAMAMMRACEASFLGKLVFETQPVMGCDDARGGSFGQDSTSDDFEAWESEGWFGGGGVLL